MKTINLQFDSLKFIPVQNLEGDLFAFKVDNYIDKFNNSDDKNIFTCYKIELNGELAGKKYFFPIDELSPIGVKVINA